MFRPWLQVEWFRKITNYQKKIVFFQKFSDEVMDRVNAIHFLFLSLSHSLTRIHSFIHPFIRSKTLSLAFIQSGNRCRSQATNARKKTAHAYAYMLSVFALSVRNYAAWLSVFCELPVLLDCRSFAKVFHLNCS